MCTIYTVLSVCQTIYIVRPCHAKLPPAGRRAAVGGWRIAEPPLCFPLLWVGCDHGARHVAEQTTQRGLESHGIHPTQYGFKPCGKPHWHGSTRRFSLNGIFKQRHAGCESQFMLPKRRFWNPEQIVACAFLKYFSRVSTRLTQLFVPDSKIFVWGA